MSMQRRLKLSQTKDAGRHNISKQAPSGGARHGIQLLSACKTCLRFVKFIKIMQCDKRSLNILGSYVHEVEPFRLLLPCSYRPAKHNELTRYSARCRKNIWLQETGHVNDSLNNRNQLLVKMGNKSQPEPVFPLHVAEV